MDSSSENKPAENFNPLDLSALQNFTFGTQWTSAGSPSAREGGGRSRDDREGGSGAQRRDRRQGRRGEFRPDDNQQGGPGGPGGAPREGQGQGGGGPRREFRERRPDNRGGPREGGQRFQGGQRSEGGQRFEGRGERQGAPQMPYVSPYFEGTFYPDDTGFIALIKAMRASGRTYELFQIANLLLEKNERFVSVVRRTAEAAAPEGQPQPQRKPLFVSVPDGVPFDTEDAAVRHVLTKHLDAFFATEEIEVDPPKGSFPIVHKCPRTGELIGPPNYHRYTQLLQQHHAEKASDMPLEMYRGRLESVREPEAIQAWMDKMRKAVRYTAKIEVEGVAAQFTSRDDAILFLTTRLRDKVVREVQQVRLPGRSFDLLPPGEIRRALEGALQRQRRFPMDTANALRGRLRREGLFLFKLPGKTVTYVSAIRPRARRVGQVFSTSIDPILTLIDNRPFVKLAEFERRILGLDAAAAPAPAPAAAAEGEAPAAAPASAAGEFTEDQKQQLVKALRDLRWLVMEGYVVEFADGRLYALPAASSDAKAAAAVEEVGSPSGRQSEAHEERSHPAEEAAPDAPTEEV